MNCSWSVSAFCQLPAMSDWPSHHAELSRKTAEQLQIWTDRYEAGVVSREAMIMVVSVLYDTTSGMIDKDLSNLLADLHRDLSTQ
jgi:hypothetical protein